MRWVERLKVDSSPEAIVDSTDARHNGLHVIANISPPVLRLSRSPALTISPHPLPRRLVPHPHESIHYFC